MKKPSQEELETMRDARTASLIRRWLSGKKLTDEEKIEVSQRAGMPLDLLIAGPSAPGAKEAVRRAQNTRKHVKYKKKLPEYSDTYGVEKTGRVIKRWVRRGKELDDLPPLDDPPKMAAWWRRAMDHQVPDKLLGFLTAPDPLVKSGDAAATVASGDTGLPRDFSGVKSLDIRENVAAMRQTHAINKHLFDQALHEHPPNDMLIQLRQKNLERSFELLRKGETSLIEIEKQRGGLVDPEPIRAELAQVFETLRLMHETMPRRIIIELEKIQPRRFQRVLRLLEKHLVAAVEKTRADEENIFRNLDTVDGPDAVTSLLAA